MTDPRPEAIMPTGSTAMAVEIHVLRQHLAESEAALTRAQEERDSWRRTAEKLESEKARAQEAILAFLADVDRAKQVMGIPPVHTPVVSVERLRAVVSETP